MISTHPLEHDTLFYHNVYIALRVLRMRYPVYMRTTTPAERRMYRLFMALEMAKENHSEQKRQARMDAERKAQAAVPKAQTRA